MPTPTIDYADFQHRLTNALQQAWTEVRASRPGEQFYLFGIETDADAVVLTPFCNTVEQYGRDNAEDGSNADLSLWIADQEAELYGAGDEHTTTLQDEVNQFVFLEEPETDSVSDERRNRLFEVFESSLAELDRSGFFGEYDARNEVVLKIEIVDADEEEWDEMVAIMQRINPPKSVERFNLVLAQVMEEEEND